MESGDLTSTLRLDGPVVVHCMGTWLAGVLDDRDEVVLVTNEVGLGVVPARRSSRLFRDLRGMVDQQVATACDEVHLVVAGRVIRL